MPELIVTSVFLFCTLLLPGASLAASPSLVNDSRQELSVSTDHSSPFTIQAFPVDRSNDWKVSEADTEEEDTGEGESLVPSESWTSLHSGRYGQGSTIRLGEVHIPPSFRSPILRC